ncbi:unnamed protein product [Camellia sinensis]
MPALFDDECLGLEAANIVLTLQIPIHLSDSSNQLLQNPIDESESQSRNQLGQNPNDESNSESRNQVQVRWAITRRRTEIALQNAGRAEMETKPLVKDEDASNPITPLVVSPSVSHDNFNHFPEKVSKKKTEMETKPQVKDEDALNPITPLVVSPSASHDNFNHFPEKVSKKKCLGESPKLSAEDQTGHTTGVSSLAVIWSASGTTSKRDLPEGSNNMARRMIDLEALAYGTDPVPNETLAATRSAERSVVIAEQTAQGHGRVPLPLPSSTKKGSKWKRSNKGKDVVGSSAGQDSVEEWVPPFEHNGRPITTLDSVMESCDLAFDLSKALLLPLDMAEHNVSTSDLMKEVTQLLMVCIQQLHVMDARRQTREEEYNQMTNLMAETELALKLVEAKLKQAKLKAKEAKVVSMHPQNLMANLPVATPTVTRSPSPTPTQNGSFVSSIPAFFPRPNPTIELFETEETQPIQPRRKVKKCPQTETETYEASPEDEWCPLLKVGDRALKCSDRAIESHYVATALSHAVLLLGDMQILEAYTEDQSLETMIQHTVLALWHTFDLAKRSGKTKWELTHHLEKNTELLQKLNRTNEKNRKYRDFISNYKREAEAAKKQLADYKASSETDLKFAYAKAYKEGYD